MAIFSPPHYWHHFRQGDTLERLLEIDHLEGIQYANEIGATEPEIFGDLKIYQLRGRYFASIPSYYYGNIEEIFPIEMDDYCPGGMHTEISKCVDDFRKEYKYWEENYKAKYEYANLLSMRGDEEAIKELMRLDMED